MYIARCALVVCFIFFFASAVLGTALDDYVNAPDAVYGYQVLGSQYTASVPFGYTVYRLLMTSQTWQTTAFSDHVVWRHTIYVCVPDLVLYRHGFAVIVAGSDTDDGNDAQAAAIYVCRTGGIGASIHQVPQTPIKFSDTPPLTDNDMSIAYTMRYFLNTSGSDPTKLLHFPMTKAAKRGLDAIQNFTAGLNKPLDQGFTVAGISKRGWATWLLAAVDPRVRSIMPTNIGLLNMGNNIPYEWRSYGEWGFALQPYTDQKIFNYVGLPIYDLLNTHIDPISYNDRYVNVEKLVVCASMDQFFLLDGPRHFYSQLKGPKHLTIIPNADHSFIVPGSVDKLITLLVAWFNIQAQRAPVPAQSWELKYSNNSQTVPYVEITTDSYAKVLYATQWTITTPSFRPGVRDFRLNYCSNISLTSPQCFNYVLTGINYVPKLLEAYGVQGNTAKYEANITNLLIAPTLAQQRWTGFYIEIMYSITLAGIGKVNLSLTSEANIFPDIYPFPFRPEDYGSVGYTPEQVCAAKGGVSFSKVQTGGWSDGVNTFTQWSVTLNNNVDLYNVNFRIDGADITQIWNADLVSGNTYSLPSWYYQNGVIPAGSTSVTFGYITKTATSGSITLANDACRQSVISGCSLSVTPVVADTWSDSTNTYRRITLQITNTGTRVAARTQVDFSFSAGSSLSSYWNLAPVGGSSYSCPLYNLPAGSTHDSCGYILVGSASVALSNPVCLN